MMAIMITMLLKNVRYVTRPVRYALLDCRILALLVVLCTIFSYRKLPAIQHALISSIIIRLILPARHALRIVKCAWTRLIAVNAQLVHSSLSRRAFLLVLMVLTLWLLHLVAYVMTARLAVRPVKTRLYAWPAWINSTTAVLLDSALAVIPFVWHVLDPVKINAYLVLLLCFYLVLLAPFYHAVLAFMSILREVVEAVQSYSLDRSTAI